MDTVKGYFDYSISERCFSSADFPKTRKLLVELGFRTIAIDQVLEEANLEPKKKKKKGESREAIDIVPVPVDLADFKDCDGLKILNRLTIAFSNQEIFNKITKSPNYKKYQIIAVLPLTQNAIQYTCNNIDADILTYDPENKISYKINRKMYNQLADKGFHYELRYAPAIQDSTQRKNLIHISHLYHSFGKSRNIILSSGAVNRMWLRGPYDIINLGFIFGLSEEQAKNSILHCGRNVYLNAMGRCYGKTIMFAENVPENLVNDDNNLKKDRVKDDAEVEEEDEEMECEQPAQKKTKQ